MTILTYLSASVLQNVKQKLIGPATTIVCTRNASKKASGNVRNPPKHPRPKHRRWHVSDGMFVQAGRILVTQIKLKFHPGLNVGFGKNGTLFAIEPGKVLVTCEVFDPNWDHTWVQRHYAGREEQRMYKKYYNIIPRPQHGYFKLIDKI